MDKNLLNWEKIYKEQILPFHQKRKDYFVYDYNKIINLNLKVIKVVGDIVNKENYSINDIKTILNYFIELQKIDVPTTYFKHSNINQTIDMFKDVSNDRLLFEISKFYNNVDTLAIIYILYNRAFKNENNLTNIYFEKAKLFEDELKEKYPYVKLKFTYHKEDDYFQIGYFIEKENDEFGYFLGELLGKYYYDENLLNVGLWKCLSNDFEGDINNG